ncbi:conserved protein, unknown function [Hepatocystis sp. ex Piliocolobus tephrosceles]|nr:conserved protein, unknown function [Hepatocystis sp. ex Piliocolobus tephrosceles]
MTLVRKVRGNVLQTFKEIYQRGKSLNIHKTAFLSQTYEKNCWRKTRVREEKVYYKKYNFLKYAYDVVNYGINNNLKFQVEDKQIVEEDSYIDEDDEERKKKSETETYIKKYITKIDVDKENILKYVENLHKKENNKKFKYLYYNVMNKNIPLKKHEFIKKYNNLYNNPTDVIIIYYYIKKYKLLTKKKNYLINKLNILKLRKNITDKVNYSFPVKKLEEMFNDHSKKINVL